MGKSAASREGLSLTFFPFFIASAAGAIREFPMMNTVWTSDKIIVKRDVNLCVLIGTEEAVFAPVSKNADRMRWPGKSGKGGLPWTIFGRGRSR